MAKMGDLKITFEIEPIVKLKCWNKDCSNNQYDSFQSFTCNLKSLYISEAGECLYNTAKGKK